MLAGRLVDEAKQWGALGVVVLILVGLGLINQYTRRAAIILAVVLAIPLVLKGQSK